MSLGRWLYAPPDGWPPVAAFGGSSSAPPPPPPPQPMPDTQDPAALLRRRQVLDAAMARSGRLSTMLSDQGGYGSNKLGVS